MSNSVLVVVAHPDDETLMCGGTIAKHVAAGDSVRVLIIADGVTSRDGTDMRDVNARAKMADAASKVLGFDGDIAGFPDQQLDKVGLLAIAKRIEVEIAKCQPALVYTHWLHDLNLDHKLVAEATMVACRTKPGCKVMTLLMGEVPSSTEYAGGFKPCVYVDIGAHWLKKAEAMGCYGDEIPADERHPRSVDSVRALARWRGASVGIDCAEAFELVRMIL